MGSTFEKLSSNKVKLSFVVDKDVFAAALKKAYTKTAGRFNIPGFRRGKAPMHVIEMHYGPSVFFEEAFDEVFPTVYAEALREHNVDPVDRPEELDVTQIEKGKDLIFSCEVYVRPEVTLGNYKELEAEKTNVEVTDDDVAAEIERVRERNARFIEVTDRAAKLDDQVNIDYAGFDGDNQFEGGTSKGFDLTLGSGMFIPGFEEQLVDKVPGEQVTVHVTFPEQYHSEALAGKAAEFRCTIHQIRVKTPYELDDVFAKEVGRCDTLEEMKNKLKESMQSWADEQGEMDLQDQLLRQAAATLDYTPSTEELEQAMDEQLRVMEAQLGQQGLNLDMYCNFMNTTREALREESRAAADAFLRNQAAIDKIVQLEALEPTQQEIGEAIALICQQNGMTVEQLKPYYTPEFEKAVTNSVLTSKVMRLIRDAADIAEV